MSNASHAFSSNKFKVVSAKSSPPAPSASEGERAANATFVPIVKPSKFVKQSLKNEEYAARYESCVHNALQYKRTELHQIYPNEYNSHRGCMQRAKEMHIKFDNRLKDFRDFLIHLGPRPAENWSVDRMDPYKGYVPGNVRWATKMEQTRNRKVTKWHKIDGKHLTTNQLANYLGLPYDTLYKRLRRGWTLPRLLDEQNKGGAMNQWAFPKELASALEPQFKKRTAAKQTRIRWFIKYIDNLIKQLCTITQKEEIAFLLPYLERANKDLYNFMLADREKAKKEVDDLMNAIAANGADHHETPS